MSEMALRSLSLAVLLLMVGPLASDASADPSIAVNPPMPNVGMPATFSCAACAEGAVVQWDLNGDGTFGGAEDANPHTYKSPGTKPVAMTVDGAHIEGSVTVNGAPAVTFDFEPERPLARQPVSFEAEVKDPEKDPVSLAWNFGDGLPTESGVKPSHSYASAGPYTVTVTATDPNGASGSASRSIVVRADPGPTSSFRFSPTVPNVGQRVIFTSVSEASQGRIVAWDWDLDGVGDFDDLTGAIVQHRFGTPGTHAIRLRVRQSNDLEAVSSTSLRVNGLPVADFRWDPVSAVAGNSVDLISTSTDFEGPLATFSWDLDGDGKFDDGSGPKLRQPFPKAGTYDIGLRVRDSDGELSTVRKRVRVASPSQPGPGTTSPSAPTGNPAPAPRRLRFMSPFPIVRIAGTVLARGARVDVLSVRTPRGARVEVRCAGKGCPVGSIATTSARRLVRFRKFERRLRAGTTLRIYVRQTGRIGKYTRFLIRAGKAPARVDSCLLPGRARPVRCP